MIPRFELNPVKGSTALLELRSPTDFVAARESGATGGRAQAIGLQHHDFAPVVRPAWSRDATLSNRRYPNLPVATLEP